MMILFESLGYNKKVIRLNPDINVLKLISCFLPNLSMKIEVTKIPIIGRISRKVESKYISFISNPIWSMISGKNTNTPIPNAGKNQSMMRGTVVLYFLTTRSLQIDISLLSLINLFSSSS